MKSSKSFYILILKRFAGKANHICSVQKLLVHSRVTGSSSVNRGVMHSSRKLLLACTFFLEGTNTNTSASMRLEASASPPVLVVVPNYLRSFFTG